MALPLVGQAASSKVSLDQHEPQRKVYKQALKALDKGNIKQFRRLKSMLRHYPLYPYLEYRDLKRRLSVAKRQEVDQFLKHYQHTPYAERIRYRWLKVKVRKGHWNHFLRYFSDSMTSATMRCHWANAHLRTKRAMPDKAIAELWDVGHSQPKACDPVFAAWRKAGKLSNKRLWSRYQKAMSKRNFGLAKYLQKSMASRDKHLADLYREVDRYPQRLSNTRKFSTRRASEQYKFNDIILHGFGRYARKDAKAAYKIWGRYDSKNLFKQDQRLEILYSLARRLAQGGHQREATALLSQYKTIDNTQLLESLLRESLAQQDWKRVLYWWGKLPKEAKQHERWQYWLARSLEQTGAARRPAPGLQADAIYRKLANERSFYGFLSADRLQQPYELGHEPLQISKAQKRDMLKLEGVQRVHEFYHLGDKLNANREWLHLAKKLDKGQMKTLASLTHDWNWHIKTIQGMANVKYWDDLEMRFPLAYNRELRKAAKATNIEPTLLYAIARQESAFAADARSPAGAMGLMQLMPATAKQTARKIGVKYRRKDLYKPHSNIRLGSSYLNQLLRRFNGNRALAAAAYNAGPHRVDRWLRDSSAKLEIDTWIETIPFRETRGYVQNVLSYSVIYAYLMGDKRPLLTKAEARANL
ncbi:MAG: transglycosylase SLT domain-containing protein [Cellvibrionaceae bacterium]|nr:transglycosylase SLT domain-containing protein [Cellvibrionaceae bacterium]